MLAFGERKSSSSTGRPVLQIGQLIPKVFFSQSGWFELEDGSRSLPVIPPPAVGHQEYPFYYFKLSSHGL